MISVLLQVQHDLHGRQPFLLETCTLQTYLVVNTEYCFVLTAKQHGTGTDLTRNKFTPTDTRGNQLQPSKNPFYEPGKLMF